MNNLLSKLTPFQKRKLLAFIFGVLFIGAIHLFVKDEGWKYFLSCAIVLILAIIFSAGNYLLYGIITVFFLAVIYVQKDDPNQWLWLPYLVTLGYWAFKPEN
ncbi:MAG: hypothetical protein IIY44_01715 [Erysipelotrichales bacterium]|nr:hypothetical protein [Erysipelotrichales bacterium]MBQ1386846.1 hypothetical protein [Erysipelotrichales bacterium]MBQ4375314.1 hypothetical protein [Erysipelotrichales bacterium]MBQ5542924.1 hypothetical protein [Erysipelotrichales bacterium]